MKRPSPLRESRDNDVPGSDVTGVPHACQWRLKYCTSRSCFSAAARVSKVPRLRRLPVFGSILRE